LNPRLAVILLLASVLVHFPSHPADFSFDDKDFVQQNASIRSLAEALSSFATPFPPEDARRGLYRPITAISYALDYQLFAMDAWGFHLSNTLLYAAIVLLVARLAFRYSGSVPFALAVGLIFSLHPVHSEAVDSVSGRSELLALLFSLASLLCFLNLVKPDTKPGGEDRPDPRRALVTSAGFYALACLSKETGVVLPAILSVQFLIFAPRTGATEYGSFWKQGAAWLAPFAFVLLGYFVLRTNAIGHFSASDPILVDVSIAGRILTAGAVFSEYLGLLVFPQILQVDFYYQGAVGIQREFNSTSLVGLLEIALLLAGWSVILWRLSRRSWEGAEEDLRDLRIIAVAASVFFVFLLPVSHVFDIGALMAERFLFAPSLGFVLALCAGFSIALRRLSLGADLSRSLATITLIAICLLAGLRSYERAGEWRSDVRLWESAARHIDDDERVHGNLGQAYLKSERFERAEEELKRALALHPEYRDALGNLALLYWETGRFESASHTYHRILALNPEDPMTWNNLGVIEARRKRHARAIEHFEQALRFNPNFALARRNLAHSREMAREEAERDGLDISAN
jgi:tetratricopeptide (TPR) repeat protein